MTHPTQPLHVHLQGLVGKGTIRFLAVIPHGKGTREVAVEVTPDLILRLADALRATRGSACDTANSRIADPTDDGYHVGHAVWPVGRVRDGETRALRKCLDCNGAGMHITGPAA